MILLTNQNNLLTIHLKTQKNLLTIHLNTQKDVLVVVYLVVKKIIDEKKKKQEPGLYINVPGKMKVTLYDAVEPIHVEELPAGQFGNVELLSGALFNKRYATHVWMNPISGAVDRLEAEQPK